MENKIYDLTNYNTSHNHLLIYIYPLSDYLYKNNIIKNVKILLHLYYFVILIYSHNIYP